MYGSVYTQLQICWCQRNKEFKKTQKKILLPCKVKKKHAKDGILLT